jgi:hypothetical protein
MYGIPGVWLNIRLQFPVRNRRIHGTLSVVGSSWTWTLPSRSVKYSRLKFLFSTFAEILKVLGLKLSLINILGGNKVVKVNWLGKISEFKVEELLCFDCLIINPG